MLQTASLFVVAIVACYFLVLGAVALVAPSRAERFLLGFATTLPKHYLELALRLIAGSAFLLCAPLARFPDVFRVAGWILVATTAVLLIMPWRWHEKLARTAVPKVLGYLKPIGIASIVMGLGLLYALEPNL